MDKLVTPISPTLPLDELVSQSSLKLYRIIELLGMTKATWYSRLEKPGSFSVEEIHKLSSILSSHNAFLGNPIFTPLAIFQAIEMLYQNKNSRME